MPPDIESIKKLTSAQRIAAWFNLKHTADVFLRAGLRRHVGPDGDIRDEYRRWYANQMHEHDQVMERVARRLRECQERLV